MQTLRVAAVSINSPLGEVSGVVEAMDQWTGRAVEQRAELVRVRMWEDTPESMSEARRHTHEYFSSCYAQRARENACFVVLANQSGRAGYVDMYPPDSPNQPHHCGGAMVYAPDGELISSTQRDEIRDEMIVADLDAARLVAERSLANYTLRTRRPELYGELVKDQVTW